MTEKTTPSIVPRTVTVVLDDGTSVVVKPFKYKQRDQFQAMAEANDNDGLLKLGTGISDEVFDELTFADVKALTDAMQAVNPTIYGAPKN